MQRPRDLFDRHDEWSALSRFLTDERPGATLGVVSGRRRQGKTYLLDAACRADGGFFFGATQATEAESLRRLSAQFTDQLRSPVPLRLATWEEAIDALLALGRERVVPVVIDEFPYLAEAVPSLPSIIQNALRPGRAEAAGSRTRLVLCGSAMSFMGRLLAGNAPLRGRAGLELVVRPFDYRLAAEFWGITDPRLAVMVNAVVGGTPAYRREFVRDDVPRDLADFDDWVVRTVLDPSTPLFREARYLLAEESGARNPALYHSVLAAVSDGNTTRGGIANYVGRKATDISHPLTVLTDSGLLRQDADPFRSNRTSFRIAEPLVRFYHAIMRPVWSQLEHPGAGERVWRAARSRLDSNVLGPHFEHLCRTWALTAEHDFFAGIPATVASGVVNDPSARTTHEVDVAVIGVAEPGGRRPILALGEAKWNTVMNLGHLDRLRQVKVLLGNNSYEVSQTRLLCFSGAGFADDLAAQAAATPQEVSLLGLDHLYR